MAPIFFRDAAPGTLGRARFPSPLMTHALSVPDRLRRFAPVDISADLTTLPDTERQALSELVAAARLIDGLFLEQVWAGNPALLLQLAGDRSPEGQAVLHYFLINKGPWSRLDHDEVFTPPRFDVPAKPAGANFYPADATREEVDGWIASLDAETRTRASGFFSVIGRDEAGRLTSVPYSVAYRNALVPIADRLRRAAAVTTQPSLAAFLTARADAFLSNNYYASDVAWMQIDASIEPTIGPYETYEDGWFGYKAAFEAVIAVRDAEETAKLATFGRWLQALEDALPIDPRYRNPRLAPLSPIRVVNVVFTAGDANRGVQAAAFNLPNDDRIIREHGAKRVMLKNVQEAKFNRVLVPIADVALAAADRARVSFDAFFSHILLHELMHGLGPHVVYGTTHPIRLALKDAYAPIEEAKADASGLWALHQLAGAGHIPAAVAESTYATFLASAFRSIRFGVNEAHGRGVAVQLNTFIDHGAVTVAADGRFAVVPSVMPDAVAALTHDLLTIEAEGNDAAAQELLARMGVVRPEVQRVLDRLDDVPVDIEPIFRPAGA
jgi:hypothetical protein